MEEPPHFFQQAKTRKLQRGLWVFLQSKTLTCTKEDQGNCYGYMWHETSLIGRSYFWQEPSLFFQGPKNANFTMVPMGTFCFVTLTPETCQWRLGKLLRIYVTQMVTNAHLGFGGTSPVCYRGTQKTSILGNIFRQSSQLPSYYSTTRRNIENQEHKVLSVNY